MHSTCYYWWQHYINVPIINSWNFIIGEVWIKPNCIKIKCMIFYFIVLYKNKYPVHTSIILSTLLFILNQAIFKLRRWRIIYFYCWRHTYNVTEMVNSKWIPCQQGNAHRCDRTYDIISTCKNLQDHFCSPLYKVKW